MESAPTFTVFAGERCIASGDLPTMLRKAKRFVDDDSAASVLVFDELTGRQMDFNFHGTLEEMLAREMPEPKAAGPGRPKLGVLGREVSLLPKHWDWLEAEPNGISAALRRLVEEAIKRNPAAQRERLAIDATARFMTVMAGDLPGFEEASRALYAKDAAMLEQLIRKWPKDIRKQVQRMAARIAG